MADELYKANSAAMESADAADNESVAADGLEDREEAEWDDPLANEEELQKAFLSL